MTTSPARARTRLARRLSWLAVAAMASAALLAPGPALAAEGSAPNANDVLFVDGTPRCQGDPYFSFVIFYPLADGTTPNGVVDLSYATATSFDWAINSDFLHTYDTSAVIVSGGNTSYVYFYEDADDDSDSNLTAPDENNEPTGIYSVEFCFDQKEGSSPTATPTEAPTPTPTPTPTGEVIPTATPTATTPNGGVEGATGTPGVTLPPTDTLVSTPSAPAGEGWRLILLAMAGIVAGALLLTPASAVIRRDDDR